ncbi:sigma-70 family RNA polymerase sigma factor [bacterium]|nr:sigma-70 family RNA polymerase sigma factor [bacterium]MBU1982878.1 sigma-70 family RNA polymerase sigma factor [bacterium]
MKPAFEEVYDQHYDDVWRFLLHAAADVTAALDLTSQTFFRAYRAWPRFRPDAPVKSWLLRIAVNEWRRELRRRKLARVFPMSDKLESDDLAPSLEPSEVESVVSEIERHESYLMLHRAIARLPQKYSTPIMLRYFEHMSINEVADVLKRPVGTVKSLIHRGIARLQEDQGLREAHGESIIEVSELTVES